MSADPTAAFRRLVQAQAWLWLAFQLLGLLATRHPAPLLLAVYAVVLARAAGSREGARKAQGRLAILHVLFVLFIVVPTLVRGRPPLPPAIEAAAAGLYGAALLLHIWAWGRRPAPAAGE